MTTRDAVIDMIRRLPDDASIDDIMYELYVRRKVEAAINELDVGDGVSQEDAKARFSKWLA